MECLRCHYTTPYKSNLIQHLKSKTSCEAKYSDIDREEYIKDLRTKTYKGAIYRCPNCDNPYSTRQARCRHMKTCTMPSKSELEIQELKHQIHMLEKRISQTPVATTNNTTNNNDNSRTTTNNNSHSHNRTTNNITNNINITVKDFADVDGRHIPNEELVNLIKRIKSSEIYYDIFQKVLERIYFDKDHPENHTLLNTNIRGNVCRVMKDGKQCLQKKSIITDLAINQTRNTLHDTYDDAPSTYPIITQQTMNKMDKDYTDSNKEHMKTLRDDADITILNNKDTVQNTWKLLESLCPQPDPEAEGLTTT